MLSPPASPHQYQSSRSTYCPHSLRIVPVASAETLLSVEPQPVSLLGGPRLTSDSPLAHLTEGGLQRHGSVQSLVSLGGVEAELEGLGGSPFGRRAGSPSGSNSCNRGAGSGRNSSSEASAPPSSRGGSRLSGSFGSRCGVADTPPGAPTAFDEGGMLSRCLAPQPVRSRCSSARASSKASGAASARGSSLGAGDTLRRNWAPQASRPLYSSSSGGSSCGTSVVGTSRADNDLTVVETFRAITPADTLEPTPIPTRCPSAAASQASLDDELPAFRRPSPPFRHMRADPDSPMLR